ncbi:MAG: BON domain-containing protein [Acidobacteriota bacterium]
MPPERKSENENMRTRIAAWLLVTSLGLGSSALVPSVSAQTVREKQLAADVEAALLRLPYYDVFDNLGYALGGHGTVILSGQVRTPWLRGSAEKAVKRVSGVDTVVNNIEVLPPSFNDDRIRTAVYRSLFYDSSLDRYAMGANPSIRIVVKNGRVTLEGFVGNEMDKTIAGMKARQVFGVFEVTNNLAVDKT